MGQQKIDYNNLTAGYEFEPSVFRLDRESVDKYLDAVSGDKRIYEKTNTVPPMSVAALAMSAMAKELTMPPGAIHVSQDLEFLGPVEIDEPLTSYASVKRIINRGKIHMMSIGISVKNDKDTPVLAAETNFILPLS